MENPNIPLSEFLQRSRAEAGLSQKQVSNKLGYQTSQFISNWERGVSQPPVQTIRVLSDMYKVKPEVMFSVFLETYLADVRKDLTAKFAHTQAARKA